MGPKDANDDFRDEGGNGGPSGYIPNDVPPVDWGMPEQIDHSDDENY
jgi:hypothetical protein